MFHVEHSDAASGNFFAKTSIPQFTAKIAPYAISPANAYKPSRLLAKSVFRGYFEVRSLAFSGKKLRRTGRSVHRKGKNYLPNDFT